MQFPLCENIHRSENISEKMWKNVILCIVLGVIATSAHYSIPGGSGSSKPGPVCPPPACPESKDKCKLSAQENKKIVLDFYTQVFVKRNFSAVDIHYAPNIIQHNPHVGDGRKPFLDFMNSVKPVPVDIYRPVAECDLVYLHVKMVTENDDSKPQAIVDIFRVECGKIVEHWDVIQPVITNVGNPRPMF